MHPELIPIMFLRGTSSGGEKPSSSNATASVSYPGQQTKKYIWAIHNAQTTIPFLRMSSSSTFTIAPAVQIISVADLVETTVVS